MQVVVACSPSPFWFSSFPLLLSSRPQGSSFSQVFGFIYFSLLTSQSTLRESGMQVGWVRFSAWRRDVCAAAMAAAGSKGRSRLQLPPCFWSLLLPSSSLFTQHHMRSACSWSVSVFSLEKRERACCIQLASFLLVLKSVFLSRFYIIILHLKYQ